MRSVILIFFAFWISAANLAAEETLSIAIAGPTKEMARNKWTATAEYLSEVLSGYRFEIQSMRSGEITKVLETNNVDFIVVSQKNYVGQVMPFGMTPIATQTAYSSDGTAPALLGTAVIFRKDKVPSAGWKDLKRKTIAASSKLSFTGWLTMLRELTEKGLRPEIDYQVKFGYKGSSVIYAVLEGKVDAGVVGADRLYKMNRSGEIDLADFSVIPCACSDQSPCESFPYPHSTRLYPGNVLAKAGHSPARIGTKGCRCSVSTQPDLPSAASRAVRVGGPGGLYFC